MGDNLLVGVRNAAFAIRGERIPPAPLRIRAEHLDGLPTARQRVGKLGRENIRRAVLASDSIQNAVDRVSGQRRWVFPALAEYGFDVADRGPAHRELCVVPRRPGAVHRCHGLGLGIAVMLSPVEPAVTEVDSARECDVEIWTTRVTEYDEFLMVRTKRAHAHVAQALTAGRPDLLTEMPILFPAECETVQVGAPDETLDQHPAGGRLAQHVRNRTALIIQRLIRVTPPVGEQQQVTGPHQPHAPEELGEVRRPVHENANLVAHCPGQTVSVSLIQPGRGVATPLGAQEPVRSTHNHIQALCRGNGQRCRVADVAGNESGAKALPGQLPRLTHEALGRAEAETLEMPRRKYGIAARALFGLLDVVYGKDRTLGKFKVLELVAAVPYQSWERVAHIAIIHVHRRQGMARRIQDRIADSRAEQDNELWHLLILEELIARAGLRQSRIKFFLVPQAIAFVYYQLSLLLFVAHPAWSYRLNADFEDHAEHEYMTMVTEHPDWESTPFASGFADDYGSFASLADVFRQIGHDERVHKQDSEARMKEPRFR